MAGSWRGPGAVSSGGLRRCLRRPRARPARLARPARRPLGRRPRRRPRSPCGRTRRSRSGPASAAPTARRRPAGPTGLRSRPAGLPGCPACTYSASAEMRSPLAICCRMSALGLRRPRSIWLRYGLDTPAACASWRMRDPGLLALLPDVLADRLHGLVTHAFIMPPNACNCKPPASTQRRRSG